ncbi:MAG: MCE family protein [Gammaproteobacteria bacterium]|nr:MCE family protein [Gammaproteobacteria bacterium]MCW5583246.1 MCE family protein [Gammaproteobacteria bacterium]
MDTNVHYTLVGVFVISLISAIVFAIIWLSSGLSTVEYSDYLIYSQESVSGLNIDAQVEYNGVSVGAVKDITIDKNNPHLVKVLLKISTATPITRGTVATLTTRGVTGVAFVALKDNGIDRQPLKAEPGQMYPVIPTSPSILMRLEVALSRLSNDLQSVAISFRSLMDKENLKALKDILLNLDQVTQTLSHNNQKLNTIILNTTHVSEQLSPLLQSSNETMKMLNTQTLPATYQLLSHLNEVTRTLSEVSTQLKQNPSMLIRGAAPQPPGPGERR